jgi:hypothetical protein
MTIIAHAFVNPPRAERDALVVVVPSPEATRRFLCTDAYCIEPECTCESAHLRFAEVTRLFAGGVQPDASALAAALRGVWEGMPSAAACRFDPEGERVTLRWIDEGDAKDTELLRGPLAAQLTRERIDIFNQHRLEARAWGRENWWRCQDWSEIDLTACVPWQRVFPGAPVFEHRQDDEPYILFDQYCCIPKCECFEATFCLLRNGPGDTNGDHAGAARVALGGRDAGKVFIMDGAAHEVRAAVQSFLDSRPGILDELRRRKERMREFGAFVIARWGEPLAMPELASVLGACSARSDFGEPQSLEDFVQQVSVSTGPRPSRNDPCPCGSGRKYKKCCGRA